MLNFTLACITTGLLLSQPVQSPVNNLPLNNLQMSNKMTGEYKVAQAQGTLCRTPSGDCPTSPRPVGSPCKCGNAAGFVIG